MPLSPDSTTLGRRPMRSGGPSPAFSLRVALGRSVWCRVSPLMSSHAVSQCWWTGVLLRPQPSAWHLALGTRHLPLPRLPPAEQAERGTAELRSRDRSPCHVLVKVRRGQESRGGSHTSQASPFLSRGHLRFAGSHRPGSPREGWPPLSRTFWFWEAVGCCDGAEK